MDPTKTTDVNNGAYDLITEQLTLLGIVQGVGMRPFVVRLAESLGLSGTVRNSGAHLLIEVTGTKQQLAEFHDSLISHSPQAARIVRLTVTKRQSTSRSTKKFMIVESNPAPGLILMSPARNAGSAGSPPRPCLDQLHALRPAVFHSA
jgi:hydrogenase maturation protein HypF